MNSCKLLSVDSNIIKSSRDEPHDQQLFGTLSNFSVSRVRDRNSERAPRCGFCNNLCDTAAAPRDDRASTLDAALTVPQDSGTHFTCCFQTHKHLAPPFPPLEQDWCSKGLVSRPKWPSKSHRAGVNPIARSCHRVTF